MYDSNEPPFSDLPPEPLPEEPPQIALPRKKGWTILSWLAIIGLVAFLALYDRPREAPGVLDEKPGIETILFELQTRYLIGAGNFLPDNAKELYQQAKMLERGALEQRLRFIVVAGEMAGPDEAARKGEELQLELNALGTPEQRRAGDILINLYRAYAAGDYRAFDVPEEDRVFLRKHLSWFGQLALHPKEGVLPRRGLAAPAGAAPALVLEELFGDPQKREEVLSTAYTTFAVILGVFGSGCLLGLGGFVGLIVFFILLAKHKLTGGLTTGSLHGGVYAETFVLFLATFFGASFLISYLPWEMSPLVKMSIVMIGSLIVLLWPVLRGIPWRQVREDIGWTLGRQPALEPLLGPVCYIMALPIVMIGAIITMILMKLTNQGDFGLAALGQNNPPAHPIVEFIVHGDAWERLLIFIDAAILAPIVEETMFRGVLYRHLRELSGRWAWLGSVVFSGTVVSFIFAVIHPQGFVAVPVLMALAYGFTIAREWRGTLVPAMVGHGLNNALVILLVIFMMGG